MKKSYTLDVLKSAMSETVNTNEVSLFTSLIVWLTPSSSNLIPCEFPAGNPLPETVISRALLAALNKGVIETTVETGVAKVKLQLSAGHVASEEAAKTTKTRLFEEASVRPVLLI